MVSSTRMAPLFALAAPRNAAMAESMTSPTGCAEVDSERPVAMAIGTEGRCLRSSSAQRAASAAWSVGGRDPTIVATTEPSGKSAKVA